MWISQATRTEFLGIVQAERQLAALDGPAFERVDELPRLRSELMLVWPVDPHERPMLPSVIVLPERGTRDFLAWTSTYLAEYRPLTALVRVLEEPETRRYFRPEPIRWLGRLQNVCASLVLAETITHLEGDRDLSSLPGVAFGNTYSFSRARDLALWGASDPRDRLFERWRSARNLMRQPRLPFDSRDLTLPWSIVAIIAAGGSIGPEESGQRRMIEAARQVFTDGNIREDLWSHLLVQGGLSQSQVPRKSSREDRVVAWEAIARQWPESSSAQEIYAFICGYLADAIAPGSFEHVNLVLRSARDPRRTLLWYGLFAGLTPASAVRDAFNGLGRRLLRDIMADASVLDRPRADIALPELELVAARAGRPLFFTASSSAVHVEIAPCISTLVRWASTDMAAPAQQDQLFERSERQPDPAIKSALFEIRDSLGRVEGAHRKLLRALGLDLESRRPPRRGPRS
ncbi:MAG TPA: hypothetical protein VKX45_03480 [Bryobacteraceae bacterium]|jgi:hypothetical protein|nr:hypothetical protein [Bryobacteraceae bacterium]